ncbi:hypothetical protein ACFXC7_37830, partial [Streptomyces virginiae]
GQRAAGSGQRAAGSGQRAAGSGQRAAGSGQREPNAGPSMRMRHRPSKTTEPTGTSDKNTHSRRATARRSTPDQVMQRPAAYCPARAGL